MNAMNADPGDGDGASRRVYCSWSLRLSCADTEAQFWDSPICLEAMTFTDTLQSLYLVVLNGLLFTVFKVATTQALQLHIRLIIIMNIVLAFCQLCWTTLKPQHYHKYRHAVALTNRLLRVMLLCVTEPAFTPATISRAAAALPGGRNGRSIVKISYPATPSNLQLSDWLPLVRALLPTVVPYFGHANWLLPFRWVLPLQLLTCGLTLLPVRLRACWMAASADVKPLVVPGCEMLAEYMHGANMALAFAFGVSAGDMESGCSGPMNSSVMLIFFTHIVLLVLLACSVVYSMELSLKRRFVRSQQKELMGPMLCRLPLLLRLVLLAAVLSAVWLQCEMVVAKLQLTCEDADD